MRNSTATLQHNSAFLDRLLPSRRLLLLFLVSVSGLFLELMLIRWIGTEIRIFAYLQNTVLVVCFLGLGMGCFTCRKPIQVRNILLSLALLTTLLSVPLTRIAFAQISSYLSLFGDLVMWNHSIATSQGEAAWKVSLGLAMTFALLLILWEMFIPLGRILGRLMDDHPQTIQAYSVNVAGSLIGIWLFVGLSALSLPPVAWFVVAGGLLWAFLGEGRERVANVGLMIIVVALAWVAQREPGAMEVAWSPYQKLVLEELTDADFLRWRGRPIRNSSSKS